MFKKVVFYLGIAFAVLAVMGEATALQLLPFAGALVLMALSIYAKKDLRVAILVIAVLMAVLNIFVVFSLIDVLFWVAVAIAYAKE